MNGKYAGKNKSIAEIYRDDKLWIEWIVKNYKPHNPVAERDTDAIKLFMSTIGNE